MRGAASPRSASPIGPAPTRLPRMALPPATCAPDVSLLLRPDPAGPILPGARRARRRPAAGVLPLLEEQAQRDDRHEPDEAADDGEAVEVLLHHSAAAQR